MWCTAKLSAEAYTLFKLYIGRTYMLMVIAKRCHCPNLHMHIHTRMFVVQLLLMVAN